MNYLRRSDLGAEIWFWPLTWRDSVHHSRGGVSVHSVLAGACGSCPSHLSGPAPDRRQETGWAQNPQSLFSKVPLLQAGPISSKWRTSWNSTASAGNQFFKHTSQWETFTNQTMNHAEKRDRGVCCCPFILVLLLLFFFATCSWGSILIFKGELRIFLLKIQFTKHLDVLSQGLAKRNCLGDVIWLIV